MSTATHSKQVMRSGFKIFSAQILIRLLSIGFTIFIVRALTKTDFATFAVFGILCDLAPLTVSFGLESSCIQRIPELIAKGETREASAMIKTAFISRVFFSTLLSCFIFAFSTRISQIFFRTGEYTDIIRIISLGVLFASLFESLYLLSQVTQQFGKISLINVINEVLSKSLSISLYFILGLEGYIIGLTWALLLGIVLYILLLRKFLFAKSGIYPWMRLVKYAFPFYLRYLVEFGMIKSDRFFIGIFFKPEVLATYFIAKQFSEYVYMLVKAVSDPITIKICELKKDGLDRVARIFSKLSRYISYIFIPSCFGIASMSYYLLNLYGGTKYTDGTLILVILSLGMLVNCLSILYRSYVFILGKPIESLKLNSVSGIANTVFVIVSVFIFDITGIAIVKIFGFVVFFFYGRYLLRKIITVEFDKKALKDSFIASFAMTVVIAVLQVIYYRLFIVPLYVLIGLILFILIFVRILELEDMRLLADFLPDKFKWLLKVFYWFGARRLEMIQEAPL